MAQLEIKKMKQGMSYSCKEKTIILNVFKYFRTNFPEKCVTDIVRRTAKATGCSEKSIFQFRKEEASVEGFKEPSKTKVRKNININSRDIKYDANVRQAIRNIIYDLKYRNIVPSLNTILKHVNSDTRLPNFSLMTLRRLMFDMGFYYEKNGNKSILAEKTVNKDNVPTKSLAKSNKQVNNPNQNINNEIHKPNTPPMVAPNVSNIPPNHHPHPHISQHHNQRVMPMHMPMHDSFEFKFKDDTHMMPPIHTQPHHHAMPMMLNHRRDLLNPPHHMDHHVKRETHLWVSSHNMIKQQ